MMRVLSSALVPGMGDAPSVRNRAKDTRPDARRSVISDLIDVPNAAGNAGNGPA